MHSYIAVVAPKYRLSPDLVAAMVQVESKGNRFAMRVEPGYRYLWDVVRHQPFRVSAETAAQRLPPSIFPHGADTSRLTEWTGQQTSWGLMQVMGATARSLGYSGAFPGLCDPLEGLHYGCEYLEHLRERFLQEHGWRGVAAAYNAGSPRVAKVGFVNQAYVDKIAAAGGFKGLE
ncbi:MAG: transglycosylase SLT domain-containing protein [Panacagrimonas sp.]